MNVVLPALTSLIALLFALALLDQWGHRHRTFQLVWAIGTLFFGLAAGAEAIAAATGWNELLYRTWYLAGAVWTAGWLGLGTAFLLGRTRFGYTFALSLFLAGLFTFLTQRRYDYPDAGTAPILYFVGAAILGLAVGVATYFAEDGWPRVAAFAVVGATLLSTGLMVTTTLPAPGYALDPLTGVPTAVLFPGTLRLLTPFMNVTGGLSLALGAAFSAYVFMPKRRVLDYSLDPHQKGDEFLFNLLIAPFAIVVNFAASLPGALRAFFAGQIHSRVPATILIALGAFVASSGDTLLRFGISDYVHVAKLAAIILLFLGFLVSSEVFADLRVPFTRIVIRARPQDPVADPAAGRT